jgi:hypothetical protein
MSRTNKGGKGPGYEYWGSRSKKFRLTKPGRFSKTQTHRQERRENKAVVAKESS